MSDATPPFAFSQFVPGFDFLKNLAGAAPTGMGAAAGTVPGMPSLSSWVAPTLSVEEVDKRIQELKTVQYWLEQNGHALKATIQALEVQKMTLSTLRGMNVQMEDLAKVFTRAAPTAETAAPPPAAPASAPEAKPAAASSDTVETTEPPDDKGLGNQAGEGAGVVDPMQWWNALTQQFQQIANSALKEAAHIKMPVATPAAVPDAGPAKKKTAPAARTSVARKSSAARKSPARKTAAAPRPRSR